MSPVSTVSLPREHRRSDFGTVYVVSAPPGIDESPLSLLSLLSLRFGLREPGHQRVLADLLFTGLRTGRNGALRPSPQSSVARSDQAAESPTEQFRGAVLIP
jgi:hypothetical protein